jgi:hypothetical protein
MMRTRGLRSTDGSIVLARVVSRLLPVSRRTREI